MVRRASRGTTEEPHAEDAEELMRRGGASVLHPRLSVFLRVLRVLRVKPLVADGIEKNMEEENSFQNKGT
jgi:hypothetical protein